jgi:hypothetical protein
VVVAAWDDVGDTVFVNVIVAACVVFGAVASFVEVSVVL